MNIFELNYILLSHNCSILHLSILVHCGSDYILRISLFICLTVHNQIGKGYQLVHDTSPWQLSPSLW